MAPEIASTQTTSDPFADGVVFFTPDAATSDGQESSLPAATLVYLANDAALAATDNFVPVKSFEGGTLYNNGTLKIVELNGSWEEMGRQYGYLLADEIKDLSVSVQNLYAANGVGSTQDFYYFSASSLQLYSNNFQQMAQGVVQTSGASSLDVAVDSSFFEYYIAASTPPTNSCLSIIAWDGATGDQSLVAGRNFDFPSLYQNLDPYVVITVFNPDDGSVPTATIGYAGQLGAISGMNSAGLIAENNNGYLGGDTQMYFLQRQPILDTVPSLLLHNTSLSGIDAAMMDVSTPLSLVYNIASPERAYTYETSTSAIVRRDSDLDGTDGLLVAANHYLDPSWPTNTAIPASAMANSVERYDNAVSLANDFEGLISDRVIMAILDTPIEQGGPTPITENDNIWQYVATPADNALWFKTANDQNWSFVDLNKYFKS